VRCSGVCADLASTVGIIVIASGSEVSVHVRPDRQRPTIVAWSADRRIMASTVAGCCGKSMSYSRTSRESEQNLPDAVTRLIHTLDVVAAMLMVCVGSTIPGCAADVLCSR